MSIDYITVILAVPTLVGVYVLAGMAVGNALRAGIRWVILWALELRDL